MCLLVVLLILELQLLQHGGLYLLATEIIEVKC